MTDYIKEDAPKRGRLAKSEGACEALEERLSNLENAVSEVASMCGHRKVVVKYNLPEFKPSK